MKTYFAKHLPVEEEMLTGNYYLFNNHVYGPADGTTSYNIRKDPSLGKKVKLFLCSRDTQVGDTIYEDNSYPNGCILTEENFKTYILVKHLTNPHFKIIGEISKEAIWVKDGDEFDETEVLRIAKGIGNPVNSEFHVYQIKGSCGHYH